MYAVFGDRQTDGRTDGRGIAYSVLCIIYRRALIKLERWRYQAMKV